MHLSSWVVVAGEAVAKGQLLGYSGVGALVVEVTVTGPWADVARVEPTLYNSRDKNISQPGNTADGRGYNVHPSWFDMDLWNFQYSDKGSANFPWESFGVEGQLMSVS